MSAPAISAPALITIAAAAAILGIHENTVRRRIASGEISAVRVGPKLIRIPVAEVERVAQRGTR
jgi:excisionase family DNA binding protein